MKFIIEIEVPEKELAYLLEAEGITREQFKREALKQYQELLGPDSAEQQTKITIT